MPRISAASAWLSRRCRQRPVDVLELHPAQSLQGQLLLVDVTTCGRAALPPLRERGLKPIPIVVTDSVGAKANHRSFDVGRGELRSAVLVALEQGRLAFNQRELAEQLARATGSRPRKPGDFEQEPRFELANALALAVWWSEFKMAPKIEQPRLPQLPIEVRAPTFNEALAMARR